MSGLARQADGGARPLASRRGEPALRIEGRLARSPLEVQIGAFERPGIADRADDFAGTHYVVLRSGERGEVRHEREVPAPMIDDEEVAVAAEPARVRHGTCRDGVDGSPVGAANVDAPLERDGSETRIDRAPEVRFYPTSCDREGELSAQPPEGQRGNGGGSRGPFQLADLAGQVALGLLQLGNRLLVDGLLLLNGGEERALLAGALLERGVLVRFEPGGVRQLFVGPGEGVLR